MTDSLGLHTDSFCLFIGLCLNPRLSCWWEIPRGECIGFFFHQVESVASRKAAGWQEFVIPKHIYSWLEVAQLLYCIYRVYPEPHCDSTVWLWNSPNHPNKPPIINSAIFSQGDDFQADAAGWLPKPCPLELKPKCHRFKFRWFVATNQGRS